MVETITKNSDEVAIISRMRGFLDEIRMRIFSSSKGRFTTIENP